VRKWIRNLAALLEASPNAKVLVTKRALPSPPNLTVDDESSDTESIESSPGVRRPAVCLPAEEPTGTDLGEEHARAPDWEAMRVAQELLSLSCARPMAFAAAPCIRTS